MPKALDLITSALKTIGVLDAYTPVSAEDASDALLKLQTVIDQFDAKREFVYAVSFKDFNLTGKNPATQDAQVAYTIGAAGVTSPDPDFIVTGPRPVRINSASLLLNNTVGLPLYVRDKDWWAAVRIKGLTSSICTDLYYSPDYPAGSCYFWPVPTGLNPVRLELWSALSLPLTENDVIQLPPAYQLALEYTFCLHLCPLFQREPSPQLMQLQKEAVRDIMQNNAQPPRIRTDGGLGVTRGTGRPDFYFPTGEPW